MVDNFDKINELINKSDRKDNDFWFVQIIKRRKDNPGLSRDMKLIDNIYVCNDIEGKDMLLEKRDRIMETCNLNHARAYIRLNKRNFTKIALQTLRMIAEDIATGNPYGAINAFNSACGKYNSDSEKKWIIDLDKNEDSNLPRLSKKFINNLKPIGNKIIEKIETVNGMHLITKPFDLLEFSKKYPDISVQKDNPTLLYFN